MALPNGYILDPQSISSLVENPSQFPLSFAQQRLWFLAQMEEASQAYHLPLGLRLKGRLDRGALRRALDRILFRHEALRTTFVSIEGEPVQRITAAEDSRFLLVEHDLCGGSQAPQELELLLALETSGPFDLEHGPLIRGRLIRLNEDEHALLVTMHHIVSDGWSMGILVNELSVLYGSFLSGASDPLPALEVQYADYAVWQREWIESEILQHQATYWKTALEGAPPLLELPPDHPRPAQQDFRGAAVKLVLDEESTEGLRKISRRHGTTLFMTLLTVWAALLARLSGQPDVVIGTPAANRSRVEIEGLIGFFVNTLAIRLDLSGSPSVCELLQLAKTQTLEAQQHQDIPFEQVVELLQPERSLAHSPIFQVMFVWQNNEQSVLELPGLELQPLGSSPQTVAKFDLMLLMGEAEGRILGRLEYATSLFERETIDRWLGYFRNLVEGMVADDTQVVDQLPILSASERSQVLYEWNATETAYPSEKCVHQLFEEQVEKSPQAVAVEFEEESLSYAELNRRANQVAHYLRGQGVKPDSRVAICVERGLELVIGLLGILKAGGAYVPLDPAYPEERLRFMVEDSEPVVLLTQSHLIGLFGGLDGKVPVLELDDAAAPWLHEAESNPDPVEIGLSSHHLAYIIYTSGSTGTPKGVMIEHRNVVNFLLWSTQHFIDRTLDCTLFSTSINFDLAVFELFVPLAVGTSVKVVKNILDLDRRTTDVTLINTVPSAIKAVMEAGRLPRSIRVVNLAGEPLKRALADQVFAATDVSILCNLYGPTETTTYSTWTTMRRGEPFVTHVGRPLANTRMYILDGHGEPVPVGVAGELYIGGAGVARGYLNRAELTAERFLKDPFASEPGARMYRTGDLGRWLPDGNIEFLGRNDYQVKIRGFRIELGEIEARLLEHSEVKEAVVLAREDAPGEKRLVAYYTVADTNSRDGEALNAEHMRTHLSGLLPEYMVPAAYVRLESLPLTPNGKLDRKALPTPDGDAYGTGAYEPPVGEAENLLAKIWADLLKLDRVGRHDNFFSLGGHSLLAVTLIERMRRSGFEVDVRAVFAAPTVARMAATLDAGAEGKVPPNLISPNSETITPQMLPLVELSEEEIARIVTGVPGGAGNVQDIYPLAPLQEGILFHHLMGGEGDPYLLANEIGFEDRSKMDDFLSALQAVIQRHDILRTAIWFEGLQEPVQVVWRHAVLPIEEVEIEASAESAAEQLYARFDPRRHRIDIRQAPLFRVYVTKDRSTNGWLMMLLHHHLVGDHTTVEEILKEVRAHLLGQADRLPAPLPFRNLVAQTRLGISREEHERFFKQLLGDVEEPTAPFGLLEVRGDGSGIDEAHLEVEANLARRLRKRARELEVSAASLCHLAWAQVLAKVTGRQDVVFGTVLFGRMQGGEGSDHVMGPFINTLPIRIRIGEQGAESGVRQTHELLADLLWHEHASLALAQRCSGVPAPIPLFTALLNYRHSLGELREPEPADQRAWNGMRVMAGQERTNYPFTLSVDDLGEGLELTAQVDGSINAMRICEFMHTALESLVTALETSPATPLHRLALLAASERHQVLYEWNATEAAYPSEKCVHQLFEEQVEKSPEAVAVEFEEESLSYAELNRRANQVAHYLRAHGVKPDSRVAICVERSLELVIGLLGILKAGGAYVPLDPAYPEERLHFMVEDSEPVALLTQSHLIGLFGGLEAKVLELDDAAAPWLHEAESNPDPAEIGLSSHHLAYVIYTSGSTGKPKGVMVEHRSVVNFLYSMRRSPGIDANDMLLTITTLAFDIAALEIYLPLISGAHLRTVSRPTILDSSRLVKEIERGVTMMQATPTMWRILSDATWRGNPGIKVLCGGETLDRQLANDLLSKECSLWNMYGPTETTIWSLTAQLQKGEDTIPIGRPIANTQVYILDGQGELVPVGVVGELYIGGAGVARGYLNRPELTAERFLEDPFAHEPGARMYRTGDRARWLPDGNVEFLGRNDFQIKIRGIRIEVGEIEARLLEHTGISEAVVLSREDTTGEKRLVGYVVPKAEEAGFDEEREVPPVNKWESKAREDTSSGEDFRGWVSSYDGKPIPRSEMVEWRDATVSRILELRPRRILEIGVGSGLLLSQLAPSCELYWGTDLSRHAIDLLNSRIASQPGSPKHIHLHCLPAHATEVFPADGFDTVVINSVIQYFPSLTYLRKVLRAAMNVLKPGGALFLGDVRSLSLLHCFATAVQMARDDAPKDHAELQSVIDRRVKMESELVIDPEFFLSLKDESDDIAGVDIRVKRGRSSNELTRYRYDVVLKKAPLDLFSVSAIPQIHWGRDITDLDFLAVYLAQQPIEGLRICHVPNKHLVDDRKILQTLHDSQGSGASGESRPMANIPHPEDFYALGAKLSLDVVVTWCSDKQNGDLDVLFLPHTAKNLTDTYITSHESKTSTLWANDPSRIAQTRQLTADMQVWLSRSLPEYMIPATFVFMEELPRTLNGKLDRKALPAPDGMIVIRHSYEPPRGTIETLLAKIWSEILHVDRVGRHDNFFSLGGHSLMIVQAISMLGRAGISVLALDFFTHQTIETLAREITRQVKDASIDQAICIRSGEGSPLFLTPCGMGTLTYLNALAPHLDKAIPLYGLPLTEMVDTPLHTMEGIAARLVGMIRLVQPAGPYYIGGWSFGGVLAYEVAIQLVGADQEVAFLGVFDALYDHANAGQSRFAPDIFDEKDALLRVMAEAAVGDDTWQANIDDLRPDAADLTFENLLLQAQQKSLLPARFGGMTIAEIRHHLARLHAFFSYCAKPITTPIHLFAAEERDKAEQWLGWDAVMPLEMLRRIPIPGNHATILSSPNIEVFAESVSASIAAVRNTAGQRKVNEASSSPVVLKAGDTELTPLFCVPGAGASVTTFRELVACFDSATRVYGLQPRGLEGMAVPHTTVEAAAIFYLRLIDAIHPKGPVDLLGHSFGGWVVFEIALRLVEQGRTVNSLTILDSEAPSTVAQIEEYSASEIMMYWAKIFEESLGRPLGIKRNDLVNRGEQSQLRLLHQRLVATGFMPAQSAPDLLYGSFRAFAASMRASYKPAAVYRGPTQLVLANAPELNSDANRQKNARIAADWRKFAPNTTCRQTTGSHVTMLRGSHVASLANLIQQESGWS